MAEEDLTGLNIKDSFEGLLHAADGGIPSSTTKNRIYDGVGNETVLKLSKLNTSDPNASAGANIDGKLTIGTGFSDDGAPSANLTVYGNIAVGDDGGSDADYGWVTQGSDGGGIGLAHHSSAVGDPTFYVKDNGKVQIKDGTEADGKVFTCDADGVGSWSDNIQYGYISFNGSTGEVFSSNNLSLTKIGTGEYRLDIDVAIQNGTNKYTVVTGNVDEGTWTRAANESNWRENDALNVWNTWVHNRTGANFTLRAKRHWNKFVQYRVGNDSNATNIFGIAKVDPTYVTIVIYT